MEEDNLLMRRAANGDKEAFETLVLRHREHAVRFAARFTANRYDAEDIVQECFAKLYVRREQWKDGASFKAYLYTMIRNRCTDFFLKTRKTRGFRGRTGTDFQRGASGNHGFGAGRTGENF